MLGIYNCCVSYIVCIDCISDRSVYLCACIVLESIGV